MTKANGLLLLITMAGCTMAGCAASRTAGEFADSAPNRAPPDSDSHSRPPAVETTPAVATPRRIRVPRSALWLADTLTATYRSLPASEVIDLIAQRHPVRIDFVLANDPIVMPPPDAITVMDHLDAICEQANWTYQVNNGVVVIYDIETRQFPLPSQPGESVAQIPLRGLASGESGGSNRNQLNVTLDPYTEEIQGLVESVLGLDDSGGDDAQDDAFVDGMLGVDPRTQVMVLPSVNAISVTAVPSDIRKVEKALADYAGRAARTVRLRIVVYEVDVSDTQSRSLNLKAVRDAALSWGANITPANPESAAGVLSLTFNEGNAYDGSEVMFRWLNTVGNTTIAFEDTMEVRNNTVSVVNATTTRQYVSRISRQQQIVGGTQFDTPTVEFDELRTGWAVHVQPTIVDDDVTVRMGFSRSAFVEEQPFSFDEGRIAGTNFITDDFDRLMAVTLKDGETKLLTNLSSSESRDMKNRTPWLPFLGDGRNTMERQRETVMMMTAHVQ